MLVLFPVKDEMVHISIRGWGWVKERGLEGGEDFEGLVGVVMGWGGGIVLLLVLWRLAGLVPGN